MRLMENERIWSFLCLQLWLVHVWVLWPSMNLKKDRKVDSIFRNISSTKKIKKKKETEENTGHLGEGAQEINRAH